MLFPLFVFGMLIPNFTPFSFPQNMVLMSVFLLIVMYSTAALVPFEIKSKR